MIDVYIHTEDQLLDALWMPLLIAHGDCMSSTCFVSIQKNPPHPHHHPLKTWANSNNVYIHRTYSFERERKGLPVSQAHMLYFSLMSLATTIKALFKEIQPLKCKLNPALAFSTLVYQGRETADISLRAESIISQESLLLHVTQNTRQFPWYHVPRQRNYGLPVSR